MQKIQILKAGSTYPRIAERRGDFDLWTLKGLGVPPDLVRVVHVVGGEPLPRVRECAGVVVTGSHAMVTDNEPWSRSIEEWIPSLLHARIPFLGICYGHQLLAQALGGRVGYHPAGDEIGTVDIRLLPEADGDPLFHSLPSSFPVHATHSQTVLVLPPGAVRLAWNTFESNHAFRIGPSAWGVQFHPEYDEDIMKSYIREDSAELAGAGPNLAGLVDDVRATPEAAEILRRFTAFCRRAVAATDVSKGPTDTQTD